MSNGKEINETGYFPNITNSDIVNMPLLFRRTYLSAEDKTVLEMPIFAHRIICKILNNISFNQFQLKGVEKKIPKQLDLFNSFEQKFKTEHNTVARFTFKIKDIDPNRNYKEIEKSLSWLVHFKEGWYKSLNEKQELIKSYGGLIREPSISKGEIQFFISSYWIELLLKMTIYNPALTNIPWVLNKSSQIIFYYYLLEMKEKTPLVKIETIKEQFNLNYRNDNDLIKFFIKPIKQKLDIKGNVSFNYRKEGKNIRLVPFINKTIKDESISVKTNKKQRITQRLSYWKKRHQLKANDIDIIRQVIKVDPSAFSLLEKAYKSFIKNCKKEGIKPTDLIQNDFLNEFQKVIKEEYKKTFLGNVKGFKNGFPNIV